MNCQRENEQDRVINDPLGQPLSPGWHIFPLNIAVFGRTDGQMDGQHFIIFCEILKSWVGRMYRHTCENSYHYRPVLWSTSWINFDFFPQQLLPLLSSLHHHISGPTSKVLPWAVGCYCKRLIKLSLGPNFQVLSASVVAPKKIASKACNHKPPILIYVVCVYALCSWWKARRKTHLYFMMKISFLCGWTEKKKLKFCEKKIAPRVLTTAQKFSP